MSTLTFLGYPSQSPPKIKFFQRNIENILKKSTSKAHTSITSLSEKFTTTQR